MSSDFVKLNEIFSELNKWYSLNRDEKKELFNEWNKTYDKFIVNPKSSEKEQEQVRTIRTWIEERYKIFQKNKPRIRGCERPFNSNQYRAWFMHISCATIYFINIGLLYVDVTKKPNNNST